MNFIYVLILFFRSLTAVHLMEVVHRMEVVHHMEVVSKLQSKYNHFLNFIHFIFFFFKVIRAKAQKFGNSHKIDPFLPLLSMHCKHYIVHHIWHFLLTFSTSLITHNRQNFMQNWIKLAKDCNKQIFSTHFETC